MGMKKRKSKKKKDDLYGMAIPGFLLIGIGVGLLIGEVAPFTLIGLGIGFIVAMALGKR